MIKNKWGWKGKGKNMIREQKRRGKRGERGIQEGMEERDRGKGNKQREEKG